MKKNLLRSALGASAALLPCVLIAQAATTAEKLGVEDRTQAALYFNRHAAAG